MKLKLVTAAVAAALLSGNALADGEWTVNGYGALRWNAMESVDKSKNYEHRRDYRAAGPAFTANPNQIEFTLTRTQKYDKGAYAKYVLKTEYGNNEGGDGQVFYYSSGGNEGHNQTGELEFKEGYVELGNLSIFPKQTSIWAGRRFLNRAAGIMTKEYWKQSSGVGTGIQYKGAGIAAVSADPGDGEGKLGETNAEGHTTMTSIDLYYYGLAGFDFDVKIMSRANMDPVKGDTGKQADSGLGLAVSYNGSFYGMDGWSTSAVTYGTGVAATKGVNFGNWNGGWNEDDQSIFATTYGVWNIADNFQLGHEFVFWDLENTDDGQIWGTDTMTRIFYGLTPSYKVSDHFRMEAVVTFANEAAENEAGDSAWGREEGATTFITASLAPVFTVNNDFFGRPQIKPYVTYMSSSDDNYGWSDGKDDDGKGDDVRVGVEAEIWF